MSQLLRTVNRAVQIFLRQNSLVFRPGPLLPKSPANLGLPYEQLRLRYRNELAVPGWWIPQSWSDQVVIFFHGSDGNITHELPTLKFLRSLQVNVLFVEYPGYGQSEGRTSESNCYRAAEAAWKYVCQTLGFAPERVFLFGQSIGSAVGTYLASSRQCGGLVFQSGFTSVPDLAAWLFPNLPAKHFCLIKMNSLDRVKKCGCPLLMLHSKTDEHIPVAQALRIYEQAPSPKKFVYLEGSHASRAWQHSTEVRTAWRELLSAHTTCWS